MRTFVPPTQGYWLRITDKKKPTDRPEWQCVRAHAPRFRRTLLLTSGLPCNDDRYASLLRHGGTD